MKFATAVSKFDWQTQLIEKYLASPELPIPLWREGDLEEVRQDLEKVKYFREKILYLRRCIQEEFEATKPTRFTDEQLKEMRYLFSVGVSKNKLSKRYKTTLKVLSKYLSQSTAAGEIKE